MIYNKDFIYNLFDQKLDNNEFKLYDANLIRLKERKSICNNKLIEFINKKVPYKITGDLKNLLQDYKDAQVEYCAIENKLYYKNGFKDGFYLFESLKKF